MEPAVRVSRPQPQPFLPLVPLPSGLCQKMQPASSPRFLGAQRGGGARPPRTGRGA